MLDEQDLEKYSAKELLEFLENEPVIDYTTEILYDDFGESTLLEVFDIEKIKHDFLHSINRYTVVRRGQRIYIHDARECMDIMMIKVHNFDDEEAMQRAYDICYDLNNNDMHFIGKIHTCG
jgi:hypothetical protein